jgi:antitoxin component of MazEF toxin-antitoxin module
VSSKKFKLQEHGGSIVITIPRDVVRQFRLEKGKALDVACHGDKLIIDLPSVRVAVREVAA